jgi:hypothetical protein
LKELRSGRRSRARPSITGIVAAQRATLYRPPLAAPHCRERSVVMVDAYGAVIVLGCAETPAHRAAREPEEIAGADGLNFGAYELGHELDG